MNIKKFIKKPFNIIKQIAVLLVFIISSTIQIHAQTISNNGAYISISSGIFAGMDSINNNTTATLANNGTINVYTINNAGNTQGNGTYNIVRNFTNTGTFTCGTSTVNYNGTAAQTVASLNYYNLTISNARAANNITYSTSGTIGIAGAFSPNATFTSGSNLITGTSFDFNGSGAQNIPAFSFSNITVSGGNTKTVNGSIMVIRTLTLSANTTLALGSNNITLLSDTNYTARVAAIPTSASVSYGTGKFIAQRYIQGRRKYRLMTSPVTTATGTLTTGQEALSIWGNWQNQGNNTTANSGTIITGGASANGFDQQTTNASFYTYDDVNHKYLGYTSAAGKNRKYTPLKAGIAYYMFVYGDRLNNVSTSSPNYTTLSASGTILTGDQTYNTASSIPLTNTVGNYTMLGNPFASPIDWATITKTNLYNTFWGWDPNLSSTGGYVTVNTTGSVTLISPFTGTTGLNQYIQNGQGFFVKTSATSPVLVIKESDKVAINNTNAFRTVSNSIPLIAVNLFDNSTNTFIDGSLAAFSPSFSNEVGKEDAEKMTGSAEVVGIENGTELLSIDARQMPQTADTISLKILKLTKPQYTLQIFTNQMSGSNVQPYLFDAYLNSTQTISIIDTNRIAFNVTSDAASFNANRFKIVFSAKNPLPVNITSVKAELKVFPNPVKNQQINFQINELEKGEYEAVLFNAQGQKIFSQVIIHQGGALIKSIYIDKKISKGIYYLNIADKQTRYTKSIFIE